MATIKKKFYKNIATVTGGQYIAEDLGLKLEDLELDALGRARSIVATKDKTIIVEGKGKKRILKKNCSN